MFKFFENAVPIVSTRTEIAKTALYWHFKKQRSSKAGIDMLFSTSCSLLIGLKKTVKDQSETRSSRETPTCLGFSSNTGLKWRCVSVNSCIQWVYTRTVLSTAALCVLFIITCLHEEVSSLNITQCLVILYSSTLASKSLKLTVVV